MQDDVNKAPIPAVNEEIAPGSGGISMSHFGQLAEALSSRRLLLGSLFGAMAGGLPFALARSAAAAPPDVTGSPNIPMKVYTNTKGTFVLWTDGSATNAFDDSAAANNPDSYPISSRFAKHRQATGRAKGSPKVAIDILQDQTGSYILFADGTFRQPPLSGAGAPGFGTVEFFYGKTTTSGGIVNYSNNLIVSGNHVTFKTPFREPPFWYAAYRQGTENLVVLSGFVGMDQPNEREWSQNPWNKSGNEGGFFGIGLH